MALPGTKLMLAEFLSWWLSQMRPLTANILGPAQVPDALIIKIDEPGPAPSGALLLRQKGQEHHLNGLQAPQRRSAPPALPVFLRLPQNLLLSRDITLPLTASRDVRTILQFEMDQLTPFSADELFWGVSSQFQDRKQNKLHLRLAIVPRANLAPTLTWLASQKLTPGWIEHKDGRIPLNISTSRPRRQAVLAAACIGLAATCLALPFIRQQLALQEAASLVAARAPAAHIAEKLRAQLAATASGRAAIEAARRQGDALQILAALTKALPDDTWLADLSLKSGHLTMDGQSANAAKLIALLSAVPTLRNPSFTAPVTRTNDGKADLFSIRAEVTE